MAKREKAKYSCSQAEFVSAANLGWLLFEHYVADFSELKKLYKLSKAREAKAALKAACALPDEEHRNAIPASMRIELLKQGKICTDLYGKLKRYIFSSLEPTCRKTGYKVAGQPNLKKALKNNWCSVMSLYRDMETYIENHYDELVTGENMPDSFIATVRKSKATFDQLYDDYKLSKQTGVATQNRIKALNACYTNMNNMLNDAKVIYKRDDAKRELFTFAHLLKAISKYKAAPAGIAKKEADVIELMKEMVMRMAA